MSDEATITMTEDLALPGKVALLTIQAGLERTRRIATLRAERGKLQAALRDCEAALEVEVEEASRERELVDALLGQWQQVLDGKFAEARAVKDTQDA